MSDNNSESLMQPRLVGKSFDNHGVPYQIFEDLSGLNRLIYTIAKDRSKKHSKKQEIDDISIELVGEIGKGSAIVNFMIFAALNATNLFGIKAKEEIFWARDIVFNMIEAANLGEPLPTEVTKKYIPYIKKLGKNFKESDKIIFTKNDDLELEYSLQTRDYLIRTLDDKIEIKDLFISAIVYEVNAKINSFWIESEKFGNLKGIYTKKEEQRKLITALYSEGDIKAAIFGLADYLSIDDEPINIRLVNSVYIFKAEIEPIIKYAIKYLDVESSTFIHRIAELFSLYAPEDMNLPNINKSIEDEFILDWIHNRIHATIDFNFQANQYYIHIVNLETGKYFESSQPIENFTDWTAVFKLINDYLIRKMECLEE